MIARDRIAASLACALVTLVSAPAGAWESEAKWSTREVTFKVNPVNLDVSDAAALQAIRFGATQWTAKTEAGFRFLYGGISTGTTAGLNGENLVLFRDEEGSSPTVRASTMTWKLGSTILETDIVFWDKSNQYVTLPTACTASVYIENTAIHEFGHALGLEHSTVATATMWGHSPLCSTNRLVLDADDIEGVETLYPCESTSQCNDGNACTTDACQAGKCKRTPIVGCCATAADCDDHDPCTADTCASSACHHAPVTCGDGGVVDAGADASPAGDASAADASAADASAADASVVGDASTAGPKADDSGEPDTASIADAGPDAPAVDDSAGCSIRPLARERIASERAWPCLGVALVVACLARARARRRDPRERPGTRPEARCASSRVVSST